MREAWTSLLLPSPLVYSAVLELENCPLKDARPPENQLRLPRPHLLRFILHQLHLLLEEVFSPEWVSNKNNNPFLVKLLPPLPHLPFTVTQPLLLLRRKGQESIYSEVEERDNHQDKADQSTFLTLTSTRLLLHLTHLRLDYWIHPCLVI